MAQALDEKEESGWAASVESGVQSSDLARKTSNKKGVKNENSKRKKQAARLGRLSL